MYRTTANTTLNNVCVAVVKEDVLINPGKECLVRCVAVGAQKDLEYMAEPTVSLGDEPVRPACCIVRVNNNEELWLRVINVSKVSEKLKNGETIAQYTQSSRLHYLVNKWSPRVNVGSCNTRVMII